MVNYKDLGLVNTRDMFAKAIKGGYAIPAFNFNNMEQMQAKFAADRPPFAGGGVRCRRRCGHPFRARSGCDRCEIRG